MTKTMFVIVLAAMAAACGSEEEDPNPNPPRTTTSGLSTAFENSCAQCHGARGEGRDSYPAIPGAKDESGFIAIVRAGSDEMPAFAASQISDDDLRADYHWLTTER